MLQKTVRRALQRHFFPLHDIHVTVIVLAKPRGLLQRLAIKIPVASALRSPISFVCVVDPFDAHNDPSLFRRFHADGVVTALMVARSRFVSAKKALWAGSSQLF